MLPPLWGWDLDNSSMKSPSVRSRQRYLQINYHAWKVPMNQLNTDHFKKQNHFSFFFRKFRICDQFFYWEDWCSCKFLENPYFRREIWHFFWTRLLWFGLSWTMALLSFSVKWNMQPWTDFKWIRNSYWWKQSKNYHQHWCNGRFNFCFHRTKLLL